MNIMTPPKSFRLNQYNWFGQKLLVLNRHEDLLHLRQTLSSQNVGVDFMANASDEIKLPMSDHLTYITSLALMKSGTRLDELIYTLQRLNFQKNSHYFLLLCQCLLYLGNHDTVVALCKQILNREINALPSAANEASTTDEQGTVLTDDLLKNDGRTSRITSGQVSGRQAWCLQQIYEESMEFKRMFESVVQNPLINDPRLWFIFALSLEFQLQFEDANLVHRVACKLATGQAKQISNISKQANGQVLGLPKDELVSSIGLSNYYAPHKSYSEFCIRYCSDYRTSMQILSQAAQMSPPINYTLIPALSLTLCSQANSNVDCFKKALEMMSSLDNHSVSLRNPSFVYNQLAMKCKQKLSKQNRANEKDYHDCIDRICDERRFSLDYVLIKSHIVNNFMVQNSPNNPNLYKCPVIDLMSARNKSTQDQIVAQIDDMLDSLRSSNSSCWTSYALWNNLGVCYLLKRRYIASLSCLTKAHQINPIDWRINYNLSLVYLHVGLPVRALLCALASRNFRSASSSTSRLTIHDNDPVSHEPITSTIVAISYSELNFVDEARRFYAEMIALGRNSGTLRTPLLGLVNYLQLLHRDFSNDQGKIHDDQSVRSVFSLLDSIEQAWLQRNPNDSQFAHSVLELTNRLGNSKHFLRNQVKKAYAWTKFEAAK